MGSYNGLIASLARGTTDTNPLATGTSFIQSVDAVPMKYFSHGQFAVIVTQGVSGGFSVDIIGSVAGATFPIATRQNITAVGSFPIPQVLYGFSGGQVSAGFPRPAGVNFIAGTTAFGTSWPVGFTASVTFAGEY